MIKNKINRTSNWQIEPEEILLDKKATSKLEIPIKNRGFFIVSAVAFLLLSALLGRAFWLQIRQGDFYSDRASKNSVRLYRNRPPRGIIYDRNNQVLVNNIVNFNLFVIPADIPKKEMTSGWVESLAEILQKNKTEIYDFLKTINQKATEPVLLVSGLPKDALINLEVQLIKIPAVFISEETKRDYIEGSLFSHLVGYTGKVSANDLNSDPYYSILDYIGKNGLELQYENKLRGAPGKIAVMVDSNNNVLKTLTAEEPKAGNNLILNIDKDLEQLLTNALNEKTIETNSSGAAAVVLNPKTGEVLSLVSLPNFDNNIFNGNLNDRAYQALTKDKRKPFFNRAVSGAYSSGSTIKPFIAAAVLNENVVSPDYKVDDTLGYIAIENQYNPEITYIFHDWKAHGFVDIRKALAVSANVYFYVVGGGYGNIKGLGIERIEKYLRMFGFGSILGIDLPSETDGLIPDPAWKKITKNETWYTGDTYNVSIGQGDILITPLQLAAAVSAIANDGILYKPKVVSKITDTRNNIIEEFNPEIIRNINIDKEKIKIVKEGMRGAVTEGSAYLLKDLPIKVAGKTGTAQVTNTFRKTNAWFAGFAPYENPEIAIAIVIEGAGEGSTAAVPVAKQVFEWYYNHRK